MEVEMIESPAVAAEQFAPCRLTVILHPNDRYISIALSDRMFNNERYKHTRASEPTGAELELLDSLNSIVGIDCVSASKNTVSLELGEGVLLREFIPQVIDAVKRWGGEAYEPSIYMENRRYAVDPVHSEDGYTISEGLREAPGWADIGVPYKPWISGR